MSFLPSITVPKFQTAESPWEDLTITDFSGGLCTAYPESNIRDNQFPALTNYYIEEDGSLKVRGPYRPYLVTTTDTSTNTAPQSFFFVSIGSSDKFMAVRSLGGSRYVYYWTSPTFTTVATLTDNYDVEFIKYSINDAEDVIFCNGKDTPQRWTGSGSSTDLGLTAPTSGTLAGSNSAAADEQGIQFDGNYYYKFTAWYDSSGTNTKYGESGPSSVSGAIVVAGSDVGNDTRVKVTLTGLPGIGSVPGATKINVYRSPPEEDNGPFKYVGYYTSADSTFKDTTPVGEEGVEVPADAGTPPKLKHPLSFKGRVWGVGLNADGALANKGVWSNNGMPDMFPADNYAYFPDDLAGPIPFKENVYWFTRKQIYVTPDGDVDKYPEPIKVCDKGCTSYRSIVDVGNGLVFQGEDNIYWVDFNTMAQDGDFPIPIGDPIKDQIANIPDDSLSRYKNNSVACLHKEKYHISFTGRNQTGNTAHLVWNVEIGTNLLHQGLFGGWSGMDWTSNCLQSFKGTLYSADTIQTYVMEHDFAGTADYHTYAEYNAGTSYNLATDLASKIYHFGQEWSYKLVNSLSIGVETSGITYNALLGFNNTVSGANFVKGKSFTLASANLATNSTWLIWNEGTWNNFNWGSASYGFQSSHKRMGNGGKGKNVKLFLTSNDSKDTNLVLLKLYYKVLPPPS